MTDDFGVINTLDDIFAEGVPQKLGIAVSGGGDSMALLALLADWVKSAPQTAQCLLKVVSVDHGLRPEAKDELAMVAATSKMLGLSHDVLDWTWDGRGSVQTAAREGRRVLLSAWAEQHTVPVIALGHTADDQAETVLMRLARGSGVDGLAAMTTRSTYQGIVWVRPVLHVRREQLRMYLRERDLSWVDDPSNDDETYDRVKARKILAALLPLGLTTERLTQTATHMQHAKEVLRLAARQVAQECITQDFGDLIIDRVALSQHPKELQTRVVADALSWVAGQDYRPRFKSLQKALATETGQSLHGCLLIPEKTTLRICREYAAVAHLQSALSAVWDGRWQIEKTAQGAPKDAYIAALGGKGLSICPDWRDTGHPRPSLLASPAIWQGDILLAAPVAGLNNGWNARLLPEKADFLHSYGLH